jgi:ABC-2 type transport system ATP-binding protein
VSELARAGKMILFCSHVLEVIEKVCSHVLHRGNVVAYESIAALRRLSSLPSLEAIFAELTEQGDADAAARAIVAAMRLA